MRQYFVKIAGLSALILLLHSPGFAQKSEDQDTTGNKLNDYDEIIIKRKSDKDAKVNVEIKDGQVFVNGKPVSEFEDDNISVRKKKARVMDGRSFFYGPGEEALVAPHIAIAPRSPFRNRGGWNYGENGLENANRAFLGVSSEKTGENGGAKIREVTKASAAEKAGLKAGDVITRVDEIKIENPEDLTAAIHKYKPENKITLTYKRDGKEQKTTATLGKFKGVTTQNYNFSMPEMKSFDFRGLIPPENLPGFSWSDNGPRLGIKAQDTEDGKGVKVLDVDDESAAGKAGIKEGDIITRFDGKEVNSATELAGLARESKGKPSIKIGLTRDGKSHEIEVKVPKKLKTANL